MQPTLTRSVSLRQYKHRIGLWGLQKNVSQSSINAIVRKTTRRKLIEGKDSDIFDKRQKVETHRVDDFIRRNRLVEAKTLGSSSSYPGE
jgi:hypothetical protein